MKLLELTQPMHSKVLLCFTPVPSGKTKSSSLQVEEFSALPGQEPPCKKLEKQKGEFANYARQMIDTTRSQVDQAAKKLATLRREFHRSNKKNEPSDLLLAMKHKLRAAEKEFHQVVKVWDGVARKIQKSLKNPELAGAMGTA